MIYSTWKLYYHMFHFVKYNGTYFWKINQAHNTRLWLVNWLSFYYLFGIHFKNRTEIQNICALVCNSTMIKRTMTHYGQSGGVTMLVYCFSKWVVVVQIKILAHFCPNFIWRPLIHWSNCKSFKDEYAVCSNNVLLPHLTRTFGKWVQKLLVFPSLVILLKNY